MSTYTISASLFDEPLIALSLSVCLMVILYLYHTLRDTDKSLKETRSEKELIEGEENKMFEFLHTLGIALEQDHSEVKLHREIVDGLVDVVDALGGAIYLLSNNKRYLLPSYLSENCPQLIGLPVEVIEKARGNEQALKSGSSNVKHDGFIP